MPQAPNHTITAQVGWKFTPTSRVALGLVKQGSYWMNNANTVRYAGHTLLNLTASHKLADGWEVWGQVRNQAPIEIPANEVFTAGNGWWWVPIVGPLIGGVLGGYVYDLAITKHHK